jgi:histone H2A
MHGLIDHSQSDWNSVKAGGKGKHDDDDEKPTQQTRSARAGLQFPVGRLHRLLRKGNYAKRIGAGAPGTCLT